MKHYGANAIKTELKQMQSRINEKYYPVVNEILCYIEANVSNEVPPLQCEIPLSHRTDLTGIGSTATSIRGHVYQPESVEQRGR